MFCVPVLTLGNPGCVDDSYICVGDNVFCPTNTCMCEEGYRELSGECVPCKSLRSEFYLTLQKCVCFSIYFKVMITTLQISEKAF